MKTISSRQPSNISPYASACFQAVRDAGLSGYLSIGGALGLFYYFEYRFTHDADAWWHEEAGQEQRRQVVQVIETALQTFGQTKTRRCGQYRTRTGQ